MKLKNVTKNTLASLVLAAYTSCDPMTLPKEVGAISEGNSYSKKNKPCRSDRFIFTTYCRGIYSYR